MLTYNHLLELDGFYDKMAHLSSMINTVISILHVLLLTLTMIVHNLLKEQILI